MKGTLKKAESLNIIAQVTTLGGFSIHIGDRVINETLTRSRKIWNLMAYLIIFRKRNIPQAELIDILWSDEDNVNPGNALKTLIYRTRMILAPAIDNSATQLVLSQGGSYEWNRAIDCIVDAEEFEKSCRQAGCTTLAPEKRMDLYRKATDLYRGDFLPRLSDQIWVVSLSAYYQSLYLEAVKAFAGLLKQAGQYAKMADLCTLALQVDPFDEQLHAFVVLAHQKQGNNAAALNHYGAATDFLYRNLGVQPSQALRDLYLEIMKEQKNLETDLDIIQNNLKEAPCESGAFVCEYGFFREAYRLEVRRAARQGTCVHLGLITVSTPTGAVQKLALLNKTMDQLLLTLKALLRKGDVITRYSGAQYLIMLTNANYEDSTMVMERIINSFNRQYRNHPLTLQYKLHQPELPCLSEKAVATPDHLEE